MDKFDSKTADINNVKFTIDDPQVLGAVAGEIYLSVTTDPYEESVKVKVAYAAEPRAYAISSANARFTPGNVARLTVYGLTGNETIKVYSDAALTQLVATAGGSSTASINLPSYLAVQGQRLYLVNNITNQNPSAPLTLTVPDPNNVPLVSGRITISTMNSQGRVVDYEDGFGPAYRVGEGYQTITGRVTDNFGTGLAGVTVEGRVGTRSWYKAVTDRNGNFTLSLDAGYTGGHSGWFGYTIHHYDVTTFEMRGDGFTANGIFEVIYQLAYTSYNPSH